MSTAFFATPGLLTSLHGWFRWFVADPLPAKRPAICAVTPSQASHVQPWSAKGLNKPSLHTPRVDTPSLRPPRLQALGSRALSAGPFMPGSLPLPVFAALPLRPVAPVLRVMRVLEAGQSPASVGRMVVSGRMADVCAELDRLAAREAAQEVAQH